MRIAPPGSLSLSTPPTKIPLTTYSITRLPESVVAFAKIWRYRILFKVKEGGLTKKPICLWVFFKSIIRDSKWWAVARRAMIWKYTCIRTFRMMRSYSGSSMEPLFTALPLIWGVITYEIVLRVILPWNIKNFCQKLTLSADHPVHWAFVWKVLLFQVA